MLNISDSELEILKIIWQNNGSMMFSDIVEQLHNRDFQWKKNTIQTFLARLTEKKVLAIHKKGRKNQYVALLSEQAFLKQETQNFVGKVYEGEVKGLITTLVENGLISDQEMNELQQYWQDNKK